MMPKSLGNAYFRSCKLGADKAKDELGVELLWAGPTDPDGVVEEKPLLTSSACEGSGWSRTHALAALRRGSDSQRDRASPRRTRLLQERLYEVTVGLGSHGLLLGDCR